MKSPMRIAARTPLALIAIALVVVLVACTDEDPQTGPMTTPATRTPTSVPISTPSPTDSPAEAEGGDRIEEIAGVRVHDLRYGHGLPLDEYALTLEARPCFECDAEGGAALVRFYRSASGELVRDTLFPPDGVEDVGAILRHWQEDGVLRVQACTRGYCGAMEPPPGNDPEVTTFVSGDGGVTWAVEEVFALDWDRLAPLGAAAIHRGKGDNLELADGTTIRIDAAGRSLVDQAGNVYFELPGGESEIDLVGRVPGSDALFMGLHAPAADERFHGLFEHGALTWVARIPSFGDDGPHLYWPFGLQQIVAPLTALATEATRPGALPILLNIEASTVRRFDSAIEEAAVGDYPALLPVAIATGPFLRVATDDDDCLNVRAEPDLAAAVVACHKDGVLLAERQEVADRPARWLPVTTPSGREGWVAEQFVES